MAIIPPEPEYLYARKALLKDIDRILSKWVDDNTDCFSEFNNYVEAKDDLVQMLHLAVCRRFPDSPPAEELVFNFLRSQKINPFYIPPIEELGKLKGGYALVKAISARGGLKKFRKSYADYVYKTHPEWFQ